MKYKLLAADMDATALNSNKELTPATVSAMEKAIAHATHHIYVRLYKTYTPPC